MVTVQDVKERWEKIQGDDERILDVYKRQYWKKPAMKPIS